MKKIINKLIKFLKGFGVFFASVIILMVITELVIPSKVEVSSSKYIESEDKLNSLEEEYSKISEKTNEEIKNLENEKQRLIQEIEDLKLKSKELDSKIKDLG